MIKEFLPGIPRNPRFEPEEDVSFKCHPEAEQGGNLVFMSSLESQIPDVAPSNHSASKAAISGMADSPRHKLDNLRVSDKITLTNVRPFDINTGMFEGFRSRCVALNSISTCKIISFIVKTG